MKLIICLLVLALSLARGAPAFNQRIEKGQQLYGAKKYVEAERVFQEVLKNEPNNARAAYFLGLTLLELKKFKEAESVFQRANELTPSEDEVKIGLARAYMEQGQLEKADAALNEAQEIDSNNADLYYYRGMLAAHRKDYTAAVDGFEKAVALKPDYAYAHYHAGLAYNLLKRPDKMVGHFQEFLKLAPSAPESEKIRTVLRSVR